MELLQDLRLQSTTRSRGPSRAFLAGDIPRRTNVRAPVIISVHRASSGHEPRRLERSALEEVCRRLGIKRGSLHEVCSSTPLDTLSALEPAARDQHRTLIQGMRELKSDVSRAHLDFAKHRAPRDRVSRAHPAAISTRYLTCERTVLLTANRFSSFDTAFLDEALVRKYGELGVRCIVVDDGVILLEPEAILASAESCGLELVRSQG